MDTAQAAQLPEELLLPVGIQREIGAAAAPRSDVVPDLPMDSHVRTLSALSTLTGTASTCPQPRAAFRGRFLRMPAAPSACVIPAKSSDSTPDENPQGAPSPGLASCSAGDFGRELRRSLAMVNRARCRQGLACRPRDFAAGGGVDIATVRARCGTQRSASTFR